MTEELSLLAGEITFPNGSKIGVFDARNGGHPDSNVVAVLAGVQAGVLVAFSLTADAIYTITDALMNLAEADAFAKFDEDTGLPEDAA